MSMLSPEQRARLATLFDRGADLPRAEQAAFVERECADDDALRLELGRLLSGLAGEDVLERIQPHAPSRAGTRIGPYLLLERIGQGGMGEVYAADQSGPVTRRVALKIIKPGMDSAQVVARFEAERQALARMSHPNVARILDGGAAEDGRPYFVMELVPGEPITDHCDRHKLSTRARLELFLEVCDAVQHAHQKGVIHRDLKPSNLLVTEVDGRAVPKVIDFGVARATTGRLAERTLHTMLGQVVGTLDYMSPEQADLDATEVDTRTDIYSLGVVLYELLSGLLPFEHQLTSGQPLSDVLRHLRETDPPTPSTRLRQKAGTATTVAPLHGTDERALVRQLSGDLDWICLKALEKDPARRYASASELAADVRRHLAHEPVLAARPGMLYRARKFVRRRRAGVAAGVLVTVSAAAGAFGIVSGRLDALASERLRVALLPAGDAKTLERLVRRADEDLWPATPEKIGAMQAWLRDAGDLLSRLEGYRADLAGLRARALPWTAEERGRDREKHPRARELPWAQETLDNAIARRDQAPEGEAREAAAQRVRELEPKVQALREEVEARRTWSFESPRDQWHHDVLAELIGDLEALATGLHAEDAIPADHGWSVPKRLAFARELEAGFADGGEYAVAWAQALPAIRAAYPDLELSPQMGLLPIGPDPDSGLWEFAHRMTGEPAERGPDGRLVLNEETGVVLVLLPGGTFWMGAQSDDPGGQNYCPLAERDEGPVHAVELSAYFVSKYELTQAQWLRLAGRNPSSYQPPDPLAPTRLHPVEQVSWLDCTSWLPRVGLALPSEAQWENAARAGTDTPWWTGAERESLREAHAANLADQAAAREGAPWEDIQDWPELDDGYGAHAPVGTYSPNAFGLHEVTGNVWEWCLDDYEDLGFYRRSPKKDPVSPPERGDHRVYRGGGFSSSASFATSSNRGKDTPRSASLHLGVRPARGIDR